MFSPEFLSVVYVDHCFLRSIPQPMPMPIQNVSMKGQWHIDTKSIDSEVYYGYINYADH